MQEGRKYFGHLNTWAFILLFLVGFLLYLYPLQNAFFSFDDLNAVKSNVSIRQIDIPKIFNSFNTRFLVGLSFALNYKLGGLNPLGYRITNLIFHCLNACLVFLLIKSTLYLYSSKKPIFSCRLEWPAFFASMLFLCHPTQTETVNFITQRFVLMGTFFYLLTLILYIQYRCKSKGEYLILSMACTVAAMFCKEFVVTLPIMITLFDFYFLRSSDESVIKSCKRLLPFFLIVLIVPLLLLRTPKETIMVANIADSNSAHQVDITRARKSIGRKQYFLTELNVMRTYVRLLVLPINQNLDYDYPVTKQMNLTTLLSATFLLFLLVVACITYKAYRIISFGILWFFIALSVESSVIPIGDVITEYRLYLASVGFTFLIATIIYARKIDVQKLNIIAAIILIGFSIMTCQRNRVWKDEFTLWDDTVKKSPYKERTYNNRGIAYANQGQFNKAISDFSKTIEINPKNDNNYDNRGLSYLVQGKLDLAFADFTRAIVINPMNIEAHYQRGLIYLQQLNYVGAISDFNIVIETLPKDAEVYKKRAFAYYQLKQYDDTWRDLHQAQELGAFINPNFINALRSVSGRFK